VRPLTCDMIILDYQNRDPIYLQIVNQIERYIALGILKADDPLPSIRELAIHLGINPNTVKKAYSQLETKKMIVSISTKGCFVSNQVTEAKKTKMEKEFLEIRNSIEELIQLGMEKDKIKKEILKMLD